MAFVGLSWTVILVTVVVAFDGEPLPGFGREQLGFRPFGDRVLFRQSADHPFPAFGYPPPQTSFSCSNVKMPGFYADVETGCQVIRRCTTENFMFSFICPNVTIFNQVSQSCDYWFQVQCPRTLQDSIPQLAADDFGSLTQNSVVTSFGALPVDDGFYPKTVPDVRSSPLLLPSNAKGTSVGTLMDWVGKEGQDNVAKDTQPEAMRAPNPVEQQPRKKTKFLRKRTKLQKAVASHFASSPGVWTPLSTPLQNAPETFPGNRLGTDWIPLANFS